MLKFTVPYNWQRPTMLQLYTIIEETVSTLVSYSMGALPRKHLMSHQTQCIGFYGTPC